MILPVQRHQIQRADTPAIWCLPAQRGIGSVWMLITQSSYEHESIRLTFGNDIQSMHVGAFAANFSGVFQFVVEVKSVISQYCRCRQEDECNGTSNDWSRRIGHTLQRMLVLVLVVPDPFARQRAVLLDLTLCLHVGRLFINKPTHPVQRQLRCHCSALQRAM
jgi:hypothetical protein